MRQSHGNRTMIVWPPYDLAFLSQLVSLSYAVFLLYTFEVQSQLKMISCTRLINEILNVHEDHTAIERCPHGLHTRVASASCDIRVIFICTAAEIAR